MILTGTELIQALQQGDTAAFEQVFMAYYKRLHTYACMVLKDSRLAEEVVQEVFCHFWERRKKIAIAQSLQAYLYAMVYHECLREQRRRPLKALPQDSPGNTSASGKAEYAELQQQIINAMKRLPEKCRLVFYLNRVENMKYREVASYLGLSEKTVENQMGKALRLLRVHLAEFMTCLIILLCHL